MMVHRFYSLHISKTSTLFLTEYIDKGKRGCGFIHELNLTPCGTSRLLVIQFSEDKISCLEEKQNKKGKTKADSYYYQQIKERSNSTPELRKKK